jgi:glycosyltransferase involved in cell wall biosynthesis
LIIVGRLGWKTYSLIQKIKKSPFLGTKLIWIENASDEYLNEIYKISHGLIAASYNEGLGLPILEAINSNKPVIARDIDVFREIKHDAITYFRKCASRHELAQSIAEWFIKDKKYTLYKNTLPRWEMTSAAIASIVESYSINVEN